MMQRLPYSVALLLVLLAAVSCQPHDPFCFSHPHGAQVRIDVDWSEFKEDKPDGMTMLLFPADETGQPILHTTHTITHAVFELMPDTYFTMVQNQSASEFGSVKFYDMDNSAKARVQPERCNSSWYKPVDNEILVLNPEWLAFDRQEATVTEDMVSGEIVYDDEHRTRAGGDNETLIATLVPQNVVYTFHISVKVKGINNYRSARAAFSGLADGYFIGLDEYSSNKVTHLAESWTVKDKTTDADNVQTGTIYSEFTCFGLPHGHRGTLTENVLRLSLLLVDNKTRINRMFNVGSRIYQRTTDGSPMHLYLNLELSDKLPDVEPEQDSNENGFDATVEDWGDETNESVGM